MTTEVEIIADGTFINNPEGSVRVVTFILEYPRYIHSQLKTHRCLAGDVLLHFDLPKGKNGGKRVYKLSVEDFYKKWINGVQKHICGSVDKSIDVSKVNPNELYSPQMLADVLGYKSATNIRTYCRTGRLKTTKLGGSYYLIKGADFLKMRENFGVRTFSIKDRLTQMKLRCLNTKNNYIEHTNIVNIWKTGDREVFALTTESGKCITATADHPFYVGNNMYTELSKLKVGDFVYVESMGKETKTDASKFTKHDGVWIQKWNRDIKQQLAERQGYKCLDCGQELPKSFDVHHIIPRHLDPSKSFDITNVVALCSSCHKKRHHDQSLYNREGSFLYAKPDRIVSIESKGVQAVYDISVSSDEHNYVANSFIVHNCFSSNSASSRAIPLDRMIEQVENNPAIPLWTMNQPGMQGNRADMETASYACGEWLEAMKDAIHHVRELQALGIHKQDANRLLEPFMHIRTILTGTAEGLEHFFRLRIDPAAQPEINLLATKMRDAMEKSVPVNVPEGAWMTPYYGVTRDPETILKAVARCAQVSYRKDADDMETVQRVITRLVSGHALHASPFEHVWQPSPVRCPGNLSYCQQLRHVVEDRLQEKSYAGVLKVLEMEEEGKHDS